MNRLVCFLFLVFTLNSVMQVTNGFNFCCDVKACRWRLCFHPGQGGDAPADTNDDSRSNDLMRLEDVHMSCEEATAAFCQ